MGGSVENITPRKASGFMSILGIRGIIGLIAKNKILAIGFLVLAPVIAVLAVTIIKRYKENNKRETENPDNEVENLNNEVEDPVNEAENPDNEAENLNNEPKNSDNKVKHPDNEPENLVNKVERPDNEAENQSNEVENAITESKNQLSDLKNMKNTLIANFKSILSSLKIETVIQSDYRIKTEVQDKKKEKCRVFRVEKEKNKINGSQKDQGTDSELEKNKIRLWVKTGDIEYDIHGYTKNISHHNDKLTGQNHLILEELKDDIDEWGKEYENTLNDDINRLIKEIEGMRKAYDGFRKKSDYVNGLVKDLKKRIEEKQSKLEELRDHILSIEKTNNPE